MKEFMPIDVIVRWTTFSRMGFIFSWCTKPSSIIITIEDAAEGNTTYNCCSATSWKSDSKYIWIRRIYYAINEVQWTTEDCSLIANGIWRQVNTCLTQCWSVKRCTVFKFHGRHFWRYRNLASRNRWTMTWRMNNIIVCLVHLHNVVYRVSQLKVFLSAKTSSQLYDR